MKTIILSLLGCRLLFGASIGVIGSEPGDPHIADFLKKHLEPLGHSVTVFWETEKFSHYDLIVSSNYKASLHTYKHKVIFSCYEPSILIPQHANYNMLRKYLGVFTWNHHICNQYGFQKFYYPYDITVHNNNPNLPPFKDRKLACIINSYLTIYHPKELYSTRKEIAYFYNQNYPNDFSLYGRRGWGDDLKPVYKGAVESKTEAFKKHKFSYCYENWDNDVHYVSEKIFDALNNLCVPIYLGSSNITDFVPKEAFIDAREFTSTQAIHNYISNMDEETYMGYIQAIIKYSQSEDRQKFSSDYYKKSVLNYILSKL
jgi:alpha(1,3/1,4) fucosyltransferase